MIFSIDSYDELLALHRALMEAKFSESPNDPAIQGSSLLSSISNCTVEALIAAEISKEGERARVKWQKWRHFTLERREYKIVQAKLRSETAWKSWSSPEQVKYVQDLISPLQASEEIIDTLLRDSWEDYAI
jgi:hypothetical protein